VRKGDCRLSSNGGMPRRVLHRIGVRFAAYMAHVAFSVAVSPISAFMVLITLFLFIVSVVGRRVLPMDSLIPA